MARRGGAIRGVGGALARGRLGAVAVALGLVAACTAGCRERAAAFPGSTRPVEARLYGYRHAPYKGSSAAAPSAPPPSGREPSARPEEEASAADYAQLGVSDLLRGHPGAAVAMLEEAVRGERSDARYWSDLAAALLEQASKEDDTHDLVRALDAIGKALVLKPGLPEALFNRALTLERLNLRSEAVGAWKNYLEREPEGGWAAEAKNRLRTLGKPTPAERWQRVAQELDRAATASPPDTDAVHRIVGDFPQQARERAEETYLPDWAEALRSRRAGDAARALRAARTVGDALAARGEHMAADGVAAVDVALARPANRSRAMALADGHLLLSEAMRLRNGRQSTRAHVLVDAAADRLRAGKSPFSAWADLYSALCDYEENQMKSAESIVEALARDPEVQRSPSLNGQIAWLSGLIRQRGSDPSAALADFDKALGLFKRSEEKENIGAVHTLFADALSFLGDDREAWRHRGQALALLPDTFSQKRRHNLLDEVAGIVAEEDPETALPFREAAVAEAKRPGGSVEQPYALLRRAVLRHRTGRDAEAAQDLDGAASLIARIPAEQQEAIQAELAVAKGKVALEKDPRSAIGHFTKALDFFVKIGHGLRQLETLVLRARAEREAGDATGADADLAAGLAEAERQLAGVDREDLRASYFAGLQPLFDLRIAFAVDRGAMSGGLDLAEQARARSLLDHAGREGAEPAAGPLTLALLRQRLPQGVAIVEYAALEDRLWIWVVRRQGIKTYWVDHLPAARLAHQVADLRSAIAGDVDTAGVRRLAESLYDELVNPALRGSADGETLIFVPDKSLHDLPFAALRHPVTGHYLFADHPIGVAPSASLWVRALERDRALADHPSPGALLVGNPAFDATFFPGLKPLPDAQHEIEEIARLYPADSTLELLDKHATRRRVLAEMGRFGVIHIAGHSQINPEDPGRSRLALAPSPGDSGALYAGDLESLRFNGPRLAILSACSTGLRETTRGEGVSGLTHAFLGAGIPAVVASLWDVRDAPGTARLLTEMHRSLRKGDSPYSALRAAQLALSHDADSASNKPRIWAAFQVFGGAVPSRPAVSR